MCLLEKFKVTYVSHIVFLLVQKSEPQSHPAGKHAVHTLLHFLMKYGRRLCPVAKLEGHFSSSHTEREVREIENASEKYT